MSKNPFVDLSSELNTNPLASGNMAPKVLGILGGIGPMASAYFYELVTAHTKALCDQDHLDILISSKATTPDRTACIVGSSTHADPVPVMIAEAKKLQEYGAKVIAIACNTAHYFYRQVAEGIDVPVLNMVELTAEKAKELGCTKVGIMATDGTTLTETYQRECEKQGLGYVLPEPEGQFDLMHIIYEEIKAGLAPDIDKFNRVADAMFAEGCERIILGCTELSLLKKAGLVNHRFIDSMDVLAEASILACNKETIGFRWSYV